MSNFEQYVMSYLDSFKDSKIKDAMNYALIDGKRFRPNLVFSIVKGFDIPEQKAYPAALALEMVHSYSLIHDDLPCMDDDDFRRGKPSVHKAYGEDIAVLAGDSLLTHAFSVIADSEYDDRQKVQMVSTLSHLAGLDGMIYGQLLDISVSNSDSLSKEILSEIQDYKTGALFKAAFIMGMIISKDYAHSDFYERIAIEIGRVFQIQDDLFDVTKSREQTGKSQSDIKNNKATAMSLNTIKEVREELNNKFDEIFQMLEEVEFNTHYLKDIITKMKNR